MDYIKTLKDLRTHTASVRGKNRSIALVPTMGALHDGHLSLVQRALQSADYVIVSIFVNPTQFAPHEDFDAYPRMIQDDTNQLTNAGAHAIWAPEVSEVYPDGYQTSVHLDHITMPLEGASRPGHFDGVATIVCKLLMQVMPDVAIFGEKDYQQLLLIKTMVQDLNIPVQIIGAPIIRDESGLAMSSRNAYLTPDQYKIACQLNVILKDLAAGASGNENYEELEKLAIQNLTDAGFDKIDYCTIRDADTLLSPNGASQALRVLAAVHIGHTRLIDNMLV